MLYIIATTFGWLVFWSIIAMTQEAEEDKELDHLRFGVGFTLLFLIALSTIDIVTKLFL